MVVVSLLIFLGLLCLLLAAMITIETGGGDGRPWVLAGLTLLLFAAWGSLPAPYACEENVPKRLVSGKFTVYSNGLPYATCDFLQEALTLANRADTPRGLYTVRFLLRSGEEITMYRSNERGSPDAWAVRSSRSYKGT